MAGDNLVAAVLEVLKQSENTSNLFIQDAFARRRTREQQQFEIDQYPQKLAMQTQAKRAEADIDLGRQKQLEQSKYDIGLPLEMEKLGVQKSKVKAATDIAGQRAQERKAKIGQVAGAQTGIYTLAQEALRNVGDVRKVLFPKGTPESFNRMAAIKSNVPGSDIPLIGRAIPDVAPFSQEGQDVYRQIGEALAAKQLIKTGVAARIDETRSMAKRF